MTESHLPSQTLEQVSAAGYFSRNLQTVDQIRFYLNIYI